MNEKIKQLAEQAFDKSNTGEITDVRIPKQFIDHFSTLIVEECIKECRAEWYKLNDELGDWNETSRDIGIRVGQKNGILKCMHILNNIID